MQNSQTGWQVQTHGRIFEADLEELKKWISEGAVSPSDTVNQGDARWLPIEEVPELYNSFNSNELNEFNRSFHRNSVAGDFAETKKTARINCRDENSIAGATLDSDGEKVCYLHTVIDAAYACAVCKKLFCKICPESYEGSVKLCPLCGAACQSLDAGIDINEADDSIKKSFYKSQKALNRAELNGKSEHTASDFPKTVSKWRQYTKDLILMITSFTNRT